jgi:hydroxymethylpyrimidine/phosphomethylpyrimidine kinase
MWWTALSVLTSAGQDPRPATGINADLVQEDDERAVEGR